MFGKKKEVKPTQPVKTDIQETNTQPEPQQQDQIPIPEDVKASLDKFGIDIYGALGHADASEHMVCTILFGIYHELRELNKKVKG